MGQSNGGYVAYKRLTPILKYFLNYSMYKFFPILLFAFLIADESTMYLTTEGWKKSDKLIDILKELKPEMDKFNDKLSSLLHPDKFLIKNAFKIIDTTRIENSSNDSLMS